MANNYLNKQFDAPELKQEKRLALFLTGWIGFRIIATIIQYIILFIYKTEDVFKRPAISMSVNSIAYIALIIVLLLIINFKKFTEYLKRFAFLKTYIAGVLCLLAIFAFNFVYGYLISFLKTPVSDNINEASITSLQELYRVPSILIFGIVGPICEELTYRVGLFSFCKKKSKVFAYIITIVVFALIHFNFDPNAIVNELLNLPYYAFAALAFSYTYDNYGFEASVTAHILNNLISLSLVSLIK